MHSYDDMRLSPEQKRERDTQSQIAGLEANQLPGRGDDSGTVRIVILREGRVVYTGTDGPGSDHDGKNIWHNEAEDAFGIAMELAEHPKHAHAVEAGLSHFQGDASQLRLLEAVRATMRRLPK